jgi:hypothetical protein
MGGSVLESAEGEAKVADIVYVLTNEAMADLVKIGFTTTSVEERIKQLDDTNMPLPFQCFYAAEVADCRKVEKLLHTIFSDRRVRPNREFFRADANQVKAAILLAELKDVTPRNDVVREEADKQAIKDAVARQERRTALRFSNLQIPVGATLNFVKDPEIVCSVVADGKVNFDGQVVSPSAAALTAVKRLGYNWSAVSGSDYWEYEGETLATRRQKFDDDN